MFPSEPSPKLSKTEVWAGPLIPPYGKETHWAIPVPTLYWPVSVSQPISPAAKYGFAAVQAAAVPSLTCITALAGIMVSLRRLLVHWSCKLNSVCPHQYLWHHLKPMIDFLRHHYLERLCY